MASELPEAGSPKVPGTCCHPWQSTSFPWDPPYPKHSFYSTFSTHFSSSQSPPLTLETPYTMGWTISPFCGSQRKSLWHDRSYFPAHSFTPCLTALLQLGSPALLSSDGAMSPLCQCWLSADGCLQMHQPGLGPSSLTSSSASCHRPGTSVCRTAEKSSHAFSLILPLGLWAHHVLYINLQNCRSQ